MSWMFLLAKKNENTNLLKTKIILNIKMSTKGGTFLHLSCQGGVSPLATGLVK